MHNIVSQLGDPIKRNEATRKREKLQFARILVEVKMDQKCPEKISSMNEHGCNTDVPMTYDGNQYNVQIVKGLSMMKRIAESRRIRRYGFRELYRSRQQWKSH